MRIPNDLRHSAWQGYQAFRIRGCVTCAECTSRLVQGSCPSRHAWRTRAREFNYLWVWK